jgi:hypothetical protein
VWVEDNLGVMSIGFMLPDKDDAVIWRGPRKNGTETKRDGVQDGVRFYLFGFDGGSDSDCEIVRVIVTVAVTVTVCHCRIVCAPWLIRAHQAVPH